MQASRKRGRWLAAIAAALIATTGLVVGPAAPAAAAKYFCSDYWPVNATGAWTVPGAITIGNWPRTREVHIRVGTMDGRQVAWARMLNSYPGDDVWLDWSQDGGNTWHQCGPYRNGDGSYSHWSEAVPTSSSTSVRMRACGGVNGVVRCTAWW